MTSATAIRPYRARPLDYDPAVTPLFGRAAIEVPLDIDRLRIRFTPPVRPEPDWLALSFRIGDHNGSCRVAHGVMRMLLRMAEPRPRAPLDAHVAILLLEMLFDTPLTRLETRLGGPFALTGLDIGASDEDDPDACRIGFRAAFGAEETFDGLLTVPRGLLDILRIAAPPLERRLPDPPVILSLRIGALSIDRTTLASLTPGHGIVIGSARQAGAVLVAGEGFVARADYDGARFVCKTALMPAARAGLAEWTGMTTDTEHPDRAAPNDAAIPPEAELSELRVPLSFEIGRRVMTIAELRQIGEGHVIDVGPLSEHAVSVLANGQRIAEGELVEVGQSLAVRLTRIVGK
ncbi:FliM/FliN family flagellar motor switch protein [Tanticharoenia sakaeratensis]|uniref:RhcQ protein n=1 Tax=Tanticharoenia sakaeratensis NBRC 103193 TaxID=1231623 RepID=A0A0D6MP04_9PROT|nr:FliM/FliN family flagellar motor switch protein [Tanticharoenia sakaeratensis]GAN55018.1 RhcQ protein [Tanticharoenia sakaeratensis NBRC 103193]GBQ24548.1 hypothetical protein AA103193_2782 [Tanticharoenia sakaeratensis NBRC 103193]